MRISTFMAKHPGIALLIQEHPTENEAYVIKAGTLSPSCIGHFNTTASVVTEGVDIVQVEEVLDELNACGWH